MILKRTIPDQSDFVLNATSSLLRQGAIDGIFVLLMMVFFLGNWRGAIIMWNSTPLSIPGSMFFLHWTIECGRHFF
jgi:multidrug efflux pump subunit AcrB